MVSSPLQKSPSYFCEFFQGTNGASRGYLRHPSQPREIPGDAGPEPEAYTHIHK